MDSRLGRQSFGSPDETSKIATKDIEKTFYIPKVIVLRSNLVWETEIRIH